MSQVKFTFLFSLILIVGISSCKKKKIEDEEKPLIENPGPNVSTKPAVLDLGNKVTAKFFARVVDENGSAVENATVNVGYKTAVTDENGVAIISNANVPEKLAYLTVQKSGYFLGSRSVIPQTSGTNDIKITLLKMDIIATINSGKAATVSTSSGLSIDFEGEYVNPDGSLYSGSVQVAIKHINPDDEDFSNQMPGSLFAQNESNNPSVLESYGMGAIEIFSTSGTELQIAEGSKATLHMPVTSGQIANAPATIPLWHFNEVAGYWIEEGQAALINGEYVGAVKHFSFWNCDDFFDGASITGSIEDVNGIAVSDLTVQIITPNGSIIDNVSYGYFFSYVPANVPVTFNVFNNCGDLISTWTNIFTANVSISHTFNILNVNNYSISGTFADCNNNLVTNGYVKLTIGPNIFYETPNSAGQFSVNLNGCYSNTSFTVEGFDFSSVQTTGVLSFAINSPTVNIGNITACNSSPEHISYSIDGNPPTVFFPPLWCYDTTWTSPINPSLIDTFLYVSSNSSNSFHLYLEDISIGSYNFVDYLNSSSTPGASLHIAEGINISNGPPPNIIFNLNSYGPAGTYIDITFSGTYTDYSNVSHTISGDLHVLRDF